MLDTEIGSPAEHVYPKLGYKAYGIIPGSGLSPKDGKVRDELFFYKDLRTKEQYEQPDSHMKKHGLLR